MHPGHRWAAIAAAALFMICARGHASAAEAVTMLPGGAAVTFHGGQLQLTLVRRNVLRVHFLPGGHASPPALVISPRAPQAAASPVTVRRRAGEITLSSGAIRVMFDSTTGALRVVSARGAAESLHQNLNGTLARGTFAVDYSPKTAPLYGVHGFNAFQKAESGLLRTGRQMATAGEQGDAGAPLVWSTAGFAVLLDSQKTLFDLGAGRIQVLRQTRVDPDYYLILGTPRQIFAAVDVLTGHAPLFPKWSLGFINSQWGINEGELLRIVRRYRKLHIPLDAFSLDFDWKAWGQNNYGEFRWNTRKFPDAPSGKLDRELTALGVHLIGIMKPRIHVNTVEGQYATAHHLWIPGEKASLDYFSHKPVKTLDFDKAATRTWFFNPALRQSFRTGIVGWWNDEADETGDDTQFFNMERALYDGQRKYFPQRVWSLNRNFWLGAQRYAYGLWSGDIQSGFASMAAQRQRMLSAIDVGEMWWGMDGGGFHLHPSSENYARWLEFDAFAPICRVHGSYLQRRQPWIYGQTAARAATAALDLRYRLMPYIYSYAWQDHVAGVGLVRPLFFSWPHDPHLRNDVQAWLFGQWLLVSPVVHRHQRTKQLYLPHGTWTNFFTGKVYRGGRTVTLKLDAKTWMDIPLFVRQGAIIPTQPLMQYVGQHPVRTLTVEVFPARRATHFDYYDDNGETYAYQHGQYFLQRIGTQSTGTTVQLTLGAVQGSYKPALRRYVFVLHRVHAQSVVVGGRALQPAANLAALSGCNRICWARGKNRVGFLTFIGVPAGERSHVSIIEANRH
jgi:alpha-glucosidase (family GH31 glycosyl hydrolase)